MIMPYKDAEKRREHHRKYMKDVWYPLNKKKHIGYVSNIKKNISKFVLEYKKEGFCSDCGFSGKKYPEVLEFDHLSDKMFNVSEYNKITSSISRVKDEIKKCDLVCANCHRIRTVKRKNGQRMSA